MIVFDIDETVLSNLDEFKANKYQQMPQHATHSAAAPTGHRKLQEQDVQDSMKAGTANNDQSFSPALAAIKDVYVAAYNYGLSVRQLCRCSMHAQTGRTSLACLVERTVRRTGCARCRLLGRAGMAHTITDAWTASKRLLDCLEVRRLLQIGASGYGATRRHPFCIDTVGKMLQKQVVFAGGLHHR